MNPFDDGMECRTWRKIIRGVPDAQTRRLFLDARDDPSPHLRMVDPWGDDRSSHCNPPFQAKPPPLLLPRPEFHSIFSYPFSFNISALMPPSHLILLYESAADNHEKRTSRSWWMAIVVEKQAAGSSICGWRRVLEAAWRVVRNEFRTSRTRTGVRATRDGKLLLPAPMLYPTWRRECRPCRGWCPWQWPVG